MISKSMVNGGSIRILLKNIYRGRDVQEKLIGQILNCK